MTLVRRRSAVPIWRCRPAGSLVVLPAELPSTAPLEERLSPPYTPGQAALLADAALADTLEALDGLPAGTGRGGPQLLVGTQTPQVQAGLLADSAARLRTFDAVLGATTGSGWWAFGLREPEVLDLVRPALADTGALALALLRLGLRVAMLPTLRSLHDADDVRAVAGSCRPGSRFAAVAAGLEPIG
jgi:uncharacterized protein